MHWLKSIKVKSSYKFWWSISIISYISDSPLTIKSSCFIILNIVWFAIYEIILVLNKYLALSFSKVILHFFLKNPFIVQSIKS